MTIFLGREQLADCPFETGTPLFFYKQARFPGAFALLLDAPVSVVTYAGNLAYDGVGGIDHMLDPVQGFFPAAVVMSETSAMAFNGVAIVVNCACPTANTQDAFPS